MMVVKRRFAIDKMKIKDYKTIEQIVELMDIIKVGDDIVFDNMFGTFKIIKLEEKNR